MKPIKRVILLVCLLVPSAWAHTDPNVIRIAAASLKTFGPTMAGDPPRLQFIAARIAEQARYGVCVVDELKDASGNALTALEQAVTQAAGTVIRMVPSIRVGTNSKEQYGFFWNPAIVTMLGNVDVHDCAEIERDPAYATFKADKGFDFTLCAFHTRPDSNPAELRAELAYLGDVFTALQDANTSENDIIFLGDFNASPCDRANQPDSISENIGDLAKYIQWVIIDTPTNIKQTKVYDNIFFDVRHTTEFIPGPQKVVRIDKMWGAFAATDPSAPTDPADRLTHLQNKVLDHCPVYAEFRADGDDD